MHAHPAASLGVGKIRPLRKPARSIATRPGLPCGVGAGRSRVIQIPCLDYGLLRKDQELGALLAGLIGGPAIGLALPVPRGRSQAGGGTSPLGLLGRLG